jgi:hypothetical protein
MLTDTRTHTHTHTQRERERERYTYLHHVFHAKQFPVAGAFDALKDLLQFCVRLHDSALHAHLVALAQVNHFLQRALGDEVVYFHGFALAEAVAVKAACTG